MQVGEQIKIRERHTWIAGCVCSSSSFGELWLSPLNYCAPLLPTIRCCLPSFLPSSLLTRHCPLYATNACHRRHPSARVNCLSHHPKIPPTTYARARIACNQTTCPHSPTQSTPPASSEARIPHSLLVACCYIHRGPSATPAYVTAPEQRPISQPPSFLSLTPRFICYHHEGTQKGNGT